MTTREALAELVSLYRANSHATPIDEANMRDSSEREKAAWAAADESLAQPEPEPVGDFVEGWRWMTHPHWNRGEPTPVWCFVDQLDGTRLYAPMRIVDATDFEWERRDDEWRDAAPPPPAAQPSAMADYEAAQRWRAKNGLPLSGPVPGTQPALSDEQLRAVIDEPLAKLLDHIYEYGTSAEGVIARAMVLGRAVERALRGQP